ncbi:telomere binding protein [Arachnomyces sp. PD_36]|nr:telomere binding protein [Arachnomyces sp. PD_36]
MDGLLTAVKTVRTNGNTDFITPESRDSSQKQTERSAQLDLDTSSPENILSILQSQPDLFDLSRVLKALDPVNLSGEQFNIKAPSSKAAEILHVLISTTIPDHWSNLTAEGGSKGVSGTGTKLQQSTKAALLRCLSSVAGVGALVAHIRTLIATLEHPNRNEPNSGNRLLIRDQISVLSALIKPQSFIFHIYTDIVKIAESPIKRQIIWKELIALAAAGRILSTAAEALTAVKELEIPQSVSWIGEGNSYASWLGRCILFMASKLETTDIDAWKSLSLFYGRSLSLGYTKNIVHEVYSGLLSDTEDSQLRFGRLLDNMRPHEQRTVFESMLRSIGQRYLPRDSGDGYTTSKRCQQNIGAVAGIISYVIKVKGPLEGQLNDWLSTGIGGGINGIGLRRALLAVISRNSDAVTDLMGKSLDLFGDKLYIKHTPTSGQEANAQVVLLTAGYLHRLRHAELVEFGKSGVYLNAISNRLAATSPRSRFLGMVVALAISALVDAPDKAMKFDLEEMESEEAKWYRSLTGINDSIGSVQDLRDWNESTALQEKTNDTRGPAKKPANERRAHTKVHTSKIVAIEEVSTDSEEEDDDLMSYEKPDSDASDSEDDPTLIQRSKAVAPVYIRDLLSYLRDTENAERYTLGVSTAPGLIRRKISFGTEILEHAEELGLLLVGLQEKYNIEKFHECRLQSLIALLVALPSRMGPWFAHTFFDADLSQTQRSAMLTAIGLGARELAGYGDEDAKSMGLPAVPSSSFPSKKLPPSLEATYNPDVSPVEAISKKLSQTTLQPLALNAADAVSGPDALKVRTFSSRMDVEKKRKQREQQRKNTTSKELYKTLSEGLFFPLTGRFALMTHPTSSNASHNPFLTPQLLRLFTQTITLIISTLGPNVPTLPSITHDSLALLLSLHTSPVATEPAVLPPLLSLFLAVVDLNVSSGSSGEERLVTDFATQVIEIREWVNGVFESAARDDEEVRMLAAGVLVKLGEVMERYQGRLMGMGLGFEY